VPVLKESNIRAALKKRVEEYGGEVRAVSWLGRKNAPDVLCLLPWSCLEGEPYGCATHAMLHPLVETKRPGKAATVAQVREHARLREAGFEVLVITTLEELDEWLPPR
jgi:hypothetical protein